MKRKKRILLINCTLFKPLASFNQGPLIPFYSLELSFDFQEQNHGSSGVGTVYKIPTCQNRCDLPVDLVSFDGAVSQTRFLAVYPCLASRGRRLLSLCNYSDYFRRKANLHLIDKQERFSIHADEITGGMLVSGDLH